MSVPINEPAYQKLLAGLTPDEQAPIVRALVNPPEGMQAIRILAGAGSGKTRTLIAAVVTALAMGLPPQSLLVITFTVAAEEELKKRLKDYIPAAVVDTMKVLTFHKLAGRWAKANAGRLAREFPHKFDGSRKIDEKSVAVAAEFSKFDVVKVTIDGTEYTTKVLWAGRGRIGVKLPGDRDMRWLNASEATLVSGQGGGDEEKPATALPINQDRLIGRIYNAPYRRWDPRAEREVEEEIPGLEGTGFYGYGLGGDVDSPDPRKREPRTSESPGSYMKMIDIVRSRGLLWADEDARIACLALEGRKAEVAIVRERAESDPVNGDYYRMILRYAGLYPEIYGVWKWYNAAKRKLGAWDFSDTLYAYWKHSQDAFKAVWVDEFQDNTWIQLQICMDDARRGGGVMAGIGDVRQSVFSFSGAAPAIARELPRLLPTATLEIRTNFRSWRRIVMLGNAVAAGKTWMVGSPSIPARRSDGNLYAGEIEVKQALTTAECADLIAEEMQGQLANGVSPSNLCALVRLNAHGDLLEMACLRAGIPAVRVGQSRSFFDGAIARDVLAYLRIVTHRGGLADVAEDLERIANGPKHSRRKLPKEQFSKAVKAAAAKQLGVMEGVRWIRRNAGDFKNARGRGINTRGLDELLDDLESFPTEWGQELLRAVMPMVVDPRTLREKAEEPTAAAENGEDGTEAPVDGAEAAGEVEEESDNDDGGTARSIFETLRLLIERFPEPDAFFAFVKSLSKDVVRFNKVESAEAEAKYAEAKAARVTISSVHRCVSPDTLVLTDAGAQTMREIAESGQIATTDGMRSFRERVSYTERRMLRVTTKRGYQIEITADHGMMSWRSREDTTYTRRVGEALRVGDFLRLPLTARPVVDVPLPPPLSEASLDVRAQRHTIPTALTPDMAEFLGLMVGDGTVYPSGFRLTKQHKDVVERFTALCTALFDVTPRMWAKSPKEWASEVSSVQLSRWLLTIPGLTGPALQPNAKQVPRGVLSAPAGVQARFLRGLFEDGTVNVRDGVVDHVAYTTCMPKVAEQVQWMLLGLGIAARRFHVPSSDLWRVDVPAGFCTLFRERVGFIAAVKREALEALPAKVPSDYAVPIAREWIPLSEVHNGGVSVTTYQNARYRGYVNRATAADLALVPPEHLDYLHEPIASIEEFSGPAMCVEVPDGGRFVQNGFDGCNSKGLEWKHVYVLVDGSRWPHPRADLDEETRLFYVAVTRAEDALTLVYPRYRDSEATKPAEVSTFVGETVTFMERERYIYEVLAEAQKAGWSPPDDIQVAIASNRIVWHHPENPAWTAQWEEHAGISDGSFTVYEPEKPPRTLPVDQVLAYLADPGAFTSEAPPAPPPPASTPPSRTRAMERWEAFVAWVTEHDPALLPYVDAARDWLDEPDVSEQDITRVLGWSTLADLTTLVRALCPMEGPAVRWAKSPWAYMTAFDYRGSEIVGWRGSTPVNLAGASKVWGSEIKGKVSWSTGGRPDVIGGTGVRPEQVPGLRLLAYLDAGGPDAPSATPRPVSSVSDAVLVGNVLVESNPAQPGMFRMRLQDSDALLGAGSDRALLIRDATLLALAQERGVDPLTITEAPGDGSLSFRVVVTAREQSWDHHVTADSVAAALGRAIRLTHPEAPLRWCAYPADGQTTFTDPSGATYVAMPTGAAVPAPSSVQRVEKPVVATRQREVGTLTLPARGDWQMVMGLSTSGTPLYESVRKTIPVRAGSIVLGAHIEVDDRENARRGTRMEAFRVAVTDGVASLVLVGSYVAETHSYEAAVQRINEFYGIVRAAIEPVWAADALQAKLSTTSVLPNVAALARALWEIAPEGGITAAPNGRIQVPPNTLLRRSGTNDLLPVLVDSGVLIVVGDTYAWGV